MLNDNYTAFCVNSDLLQCWRGRQNPSSLYQGIAQTSFTYRPLCPLTCPTAMHTYPARRVRVRIRVIGNSSNPGVVHRGSMAPRGAGKAVFGPFLPGRTHKWNRTFAY